MVRCGRRVLLHSSIVIPFSCIMSVVVRVACILLE